MNKLSNKLDPTKVLEQCIKGRKKVIETKNNDKLSDEGLQRCIDGLKYFEDKLKNKKD